MVLHESSKMHSRLALGTVQFGLKYGIANTHGRVSEDQVRAILDAARMAGIDTLDTAIAYGDAEEVLGQIGVGGFRIISKIPALCEPLGSVDDWVMAQVEASLKRLRIQRLSGLMLHAPDDLLGPHGSGLLRGLQRARNEGLAERIGLSVYTPDQLVALFHLLPLEILQIPLNVFDRRFVDTGWLDQLVANGVEVHARSIFLQGLLLMPRHLVPPKFAPFRSQIDGWYSWLAGNSAFRGSAVHAALAHVASYSGVARLVVGVDDLAQFEEIVDAVRSAPMRAPESLAFSCSTLINPAQWNKL